MPHEPHERRPIYAPGDRVIHTHGYERKPATIVRAIHAPEHGLAGEPMYEIATDDGGGGIVHERHLTPEDADADADADTSETDQNG